MLIREITVAEQRGMQQRARARKNFVTARLCVVKHNSFS